MSADGVEVEAAFELGEVLGEGATARVVAAVARTSGAQVAIKRLKPENARDAALQARLLQEARAVARLMHPNIVEVLAAGIDRSGSAYVVMERVAGAPLGAGWSTPPEWAEVVQVFAQVLSALQVAHASGIIHRDMKPANVLVGRDSAGRPRVKVLDFGSAHVDGPEDDDLTGTQRQVIGTPVYMSPEAATGDVALGPAADLYGVGVMMWEVVSGAPPFVEASEAATILAHLNQPLPPLRPRSGLQVPPGIDRWLARMLEKAPEARWASASEALAALQALTREERVPPSSRREPAPLPALTLSLARALSRLSGEFSFADATQQAGELGLDAIALEVELERLVELGLVEASPRGAWQFASEDAHRTIRQGLGLERARQGEAFARGRALEAAVAAYRDAADLLERAGDALGAASALRALGDLWRSADPMAATEAYQRAVERFDAGGDAFHAGVCHVQMGRIALVDSAWERAREELQLALARFALYDDPTRTAVVHVMLARAACALNETNSLEQSLEAALALDRAAPLRTSAWAASLEALAVQCAEAGDSVRASRVATLAASARERLSAESES